MDTVFYAALTAAQLDKIETMLSWLDSQFEVLTGKPVEWWHTTDLSEYNPGTVETIKCLTYPDSVRYLAADDTVGVKVFAIPFRLLDRLRYAEALYRINKEMSYVKDASGRFVVSVEDLPYSLMCSEDDAVTTLRCVLSINRNYTEPVNFTLVN